MKLAFTREQLRARWKSHCDGGGKLTFEEFAARAEARATKLQEKLQRQTAKKAIGQKSC